MRMAKMEEDRLWWHVNPFKAMAKANLLPVLDVDAKLLQKLADGAECLFGIFNYAIDPVLDVWVTIEHCVSRVSFALSYANISSYPLDRTTEDPGLLWRLINLEPEFGEFNYRGKISRAEIAHFDTLYVEKLLIWPLCKSFMGKSSNKRITEDDVREKVGPEI
ncbi:hypothetical protein Q7P35_011326 [Cladosporium inversicolor]